MDCGKELERHEDRQSTGLRNQHRKYVDERWWQTRRYGSRGAGSHTYDCDNEDTGDTERKLSTFSLGEQSHHTPMCSRTSDTDGVNFRCCSSESTKAFANQVRKRYSGAITPNSGTHLLSDAKRLHRACARLQHLTRKPALIPWRSACTRTPHKEAANGVGSSKAASPQSYPESPHPCHIQGRASPPSCPRPPPSMS